MTLVIMVIMSIAGLALLRAVDNSTLVAGNIGYKQAAIISADSAIKAATDWMLITAATRDIDSPADGFYATNFGANPDANKDNPIPFDWTGQNTPTATSDDVAWGDGTNASAPTKGKRVGTTMDISGNSAYYVINRLCDQTGSSNATGPSAIRCATSNSQVAATGSTTAATAYGQKPLTTITQVYYRITIKVVGPKNTVSYAQAFVLI